MPEDLKVDCFECKDLAFARNLAKSMKEGYGRHNSALAFRHDSDAVRAQHAQASLGEWREVNGPRVVGRFGERSVQARWEDCALGNCVAEHNMPSRVPEYVRNGCRYFKAIFPRRIPVGFEPTQTPISITERNTEERLFERVCTQMTADGGRTWDKHYFWKRIS